MANTMLDQGVKMAVGIFVVFVLAANLLPTAFDQIFNASTSNWTSDVAQLWELLPLLGVIALLLNAQDNELGVTFDAVRTSPYADLFSPNEPLSEGDRRLLGSYINEAYRTFLERVAQGRAMDTSAVHDVAQGRIWSGRDAREVGLVDTLGTLEDAIAMAGRAADMGEGPYRTRILPRPKTVFERLNERLAAQATKVWTSMAGTPLERRLWRQKRVLDRLIGTNGKIQARLPFVPRVK